MAAFIDSLRSYAKRLRDVELVLEATVDEYEEYKKPNLGSEKVHSSEVGSASLEDDFMKATPVSVSELVAYAHRISYTTFAPPDFAQGRGLTAALPPAPQDEQMRASLLYQFTEDDLGIPKPTMPGADTEAEEGAKPSAQPGVVAPELDEKKGGASGIKPSGVPGLVPPPPMPPGWKPGDPIPLPLGSGLPPPMPPGWKPGDPIPIPQDLPLPPMPPGWKSGDPVVLPPRPGGAPPAPPEGAPQLPPSEHQFHEAPSEPVGVMHVPFVPLDLNSDLEESSDYTDSSDEED